MKRQIPTEREMTDMIAKAFERSPAPDPRRLAAIEQQLLEQPRLRSRTKFTWWWLAAALAAGTASALWWAMDYDSGKGQEAPAPSVTSPAMAPSVANPPARSDRAAGAESAPASEPTQKQKPEIYRRER